MKAPRHDPNGQTVEQPVNKRPTTEGEQSTPIRKHLKSVDDASGNLSCFSSHFFRKDFYHSIAEVDRSLTLPEDHQNNDKGCHKERQRNHASSINPARDSGVTLCNRNC